MGRSGSHTDRTHLARAPAQSHKTMFSTLQVRVLSVKCAEQKESAAEEGEAFWNALISLGMQGESGPLRAVHLSRQKWPGRLVNSGRLSEYYLITFQA